jgi:hypothetical protein
MPGMKITHYKLVAHRAGDVAETVNRLIEEGWQPFGAPCVLPPTPSLDQVDTIFQAMVKYANG